ncbi:MAG: LysE family translocator [Candidatus Gastranaerophilales bacterium]|nr:LysE family translocator [Candidatus Gastranaerophilales bacterium]
MINLWAFILATFTIAVIPGPDILFVITQAISYGRKPAIMTATGLVTGCLFHTALAAFGVSVIFQKSQTAFVLLNIAGALYLFYLAFCALRADDRLSINTEKTAVSGYKKGILMNLLNPKVIIFFLAFLPQFVSSDTKHFALDMICLGLIFALISWIVFVGFSVFAARFNQIILRNENSGKIIKIFAAVSYTVIACLLLVG